LLEVDARNSRKLDQNLREKKNLKTKRAWEMCLNKNEKSICLRNTKNKIKEKKALKK
jgi:hypothetical protein